MTSEATGTSNSSDSVISSSNYCGVPTSLNASINNLRNNAHHGVSNSNATNSSQTSQCSSILDQWQHSMNTTQNSSSNSQQAPKSGWGANSGGDNSAMWSGINDGSQGNNQNISGAKSTSSEMHHSAPMNHPLNGQLEQDVRISECRDRFGNEAISGNSNQMQGSNTSLGRPFITCNGGGNGTYGNGHSMNSQSHLMAGDNYHNPNSFGAQYGSSSQAHRPNSQVADANSSSNNSPFSGWQGPNNPSYKGWNNIPDPSRNSFISHANHPNTSDNSGQRTSTPNSNNNNGNSNLSSNTTNNNTNGGSAISSRESSSDIYEGLIGATGGSLSTNEELSRNGNNSNQRDGANWGMPPPRAMGLLGGGESSLNASSTAGGWGAPPSSGTSGWGSRHEQGETTGLSPQKPSHNTWAQAAAGKGMAGEGDANSSNTSGGNGNGDNSANMKLREEQDIKLVAAFSDGWGQASVNQDTTWEVPLSPQGSGSKEGAPLWRPQANNGTEIWENNIRHRAKNVPPTQQPQQQPWGHHTPSTHIGGTWGEEEEDEMSCRNVWTGVPPPTANNWNEENRNMWGENCGHDTGTTVWAAAGNNKPQNIGTWSGAAPIKKEGPQPTGWEEPSPPTSRRTIPGNFDDGTAVWGNPGRQGKVSHWKDTPPSKPPANPAGMIRLPPGATGKPDGGMWGGNKGPRGGWGEASWEDPSHPPTSIKHSPSIGAWGDQASPLNAYWGAKPKSVSHSNSWSEGQIDTSSWGGPSKLGGKPLSKDLIWASKQFRVLSEMGFKKDDVENALRNNNMAFEGALNELQASSTLLRAADNMMMDMDGHGGKRPGENDDMCLSDPTIAMDSTFPSANFHGFQNSQVPPTAFGGFKAQMKASGNTPASLLNTAASLGVPASSLNSINTLNPAIVQKLLLQQQSQYNPHANIAAPGHLSMSGTSPAAAAAAGRLSQQNLASSQHLRQTLQQIQMAVQAGHLNPQELWQLRNIPQQIQMAVQAGLLNPQILTYPLAPQTLQLLFNLLHQIKTLHQLQQQFGGPKGAVSPQINVQITQTKQRIHNLQNQIAAQQAMFLKQHQVMPPPHTIDPFKVDSNMLHSDFRDLSIKDPTTPVSSNSQSRLNQWKLPSFDKEEGNQQVPTTSSSNGNVSISVATTNNSTEFSRAPGPVSKSSAPSTSSSSSLHPLLVQGDGTWSNAPRGSGTTQDGWPDSAPPTTSSSSSENNKESSPPTTTTAQPTSSSYNLTDLVPEFEPGKPWKGTSQLKNIEDDPHLTPGSVAKSPLSVNTIKDTDLFGWTSKSSPMTGDNNLASSLVPNPWAYTPTTSAPMANNTVNKPNNLKGLGWGSLEPSGGADLWGASLSKTRGPPPGLAKGANTWGRPGWSGTGGWDRQPSSNFLVLRNLTPQIDGSTLKTLCMQHGPLQLFHLFLNHGIALARYSTREEAAKAQSALNNCVLGNTTILVDIPTEAEVQQYLHLGGWAGNGRTFAPAPAAAKDGYGSGAAAAMWSFSPAPPPATPWEHDTNPPTSFLPGDLLGGESM